MEKKTEVLSISSGENILRYEGKSLPREAEETSKKLHLVFFFLFWYSSLTNLQCKFPLVLHVNHLLWDVWIWGKGNERVAEGCSSVWAELCARSGSWLGSAGFCLSLLQPPPFTSEPSTKLLVPSSRSRVQLPIHLLGVHLLLTLLPYDHNTGSCPVHSIILTCWKCLRSFLHRNFPVVQYFWAHKAGNRYLITVR